MVGGIPQARQGSSSMGCLFTLALFMGALYFGLPIGHAYWEYTQLHDEMKTAVRFAQTTTDDQIRRQILLQVERLDLPPSARRIRIARNLRTRRVTVQTAWSRTIDLPFTTRELKFNPRAEGVF